MRAASLDRHKQFDPHQTHRCNATTSRTNADALTASSGWLAHSGERLCAHQQARPVARRPARLSLARHRTDTVQRPEEIEESRETSA